MAGPRDRFADKTLEELSDFLAKPGSPNADAANAEMQRRLAISQIEASQAAKETSRHTRNSARYILWSVVVLTVATVITAISVIVTDLLP